MPTLYVLDNPRRRKYGRRHNPRVRSHYRRRPRRHRNPDGTFMSAGTTALANPRRRYRHNPGLPGVDFKEIFSGYDLADVAYAAAALIGIQKVQEMLPLTMRTGFLDPISAAGITAAGVMLLKNQKKFRNAVGMGGGMATVLKTVAQFPQLNQFVSPGSLVIGRHMPMPIMAPKASALPSGKVVVNAPTARASVKL